MAGHSHSKTVQPRKDAVNAKKTKIFTKIARKIMIAVKEGGEDLSKNIKLRQAISEAKKFNMPKANTERAIKAGLGAGSGENFVELLYEGYGPEGVAILIEILTNNRNRTSSEVKAIFNKYGGSLEASVAFLFERVGKISYAKIHQEKLIDFVLSNDIPGIMDIIEDDAEEIILFTEAEKLHATCEILESDFQTEPNFALIWRPQEFLSLDSEKLLAVKNFVEKLQELDDVQEVFMNVKLDNNSNEP